MENRFSNRDFEQFVKQNADQYRMYPSEKVWKNVHYTLHTRRRWYGIGLSLLLLTIGTVTWIMIESPGRKEQATTYKPATLTQQAIAKADQKPSPKIFVAARKNENRKNNELASSQSLTDKLLLTDPALADENSNDIDYNTIASVAPVVSETPAQLKPTSELNTRNTSIASKRNGTDKLVVASQPIADNRSTSVSNEIKSAPVSTPNENATPGENKKELYPMTIESVVNSYTHGRSKKKLSWEVYFSPTISYRKLEENKDFINSALANTNSLNYYTAISDINSLVTHKPDIGLQMGFTAGYPLTKTLRITAGMQFNVSKYDIRAYTYNSEVATIALNTGPAGGTNSISTMTTYRNFSGDNASWLRNLYISASMPVGLELNLNPGGKNEFGIAANVQPTYLLGDRVYLLSTDYKNYVEMPSLTRKWNISSGLEIYAGLSTGKIQWRIGPHVRYQMLSSFDKKYPVKEYLFDFGLKVGIMLKK